MTITIEQHDSVLVVALNRPDAANALNVAVMSAIGRVLTDAKTNDSIRVIVLTGAGEKIFCAGMDLKEFAEKGPPKLDGPGLEVLQREVYPKPTIAALNGTAVAGGFELALACDLIVAADHAKLGIPEVKRGLLAAGGGTRLPQRLPLALALELGLTGAFIDAKRAYEVGLVNRVVPRARVLDEAMTIAREIAANGPLAVAVTKQLMYQEVKQADWDGLAKAARSVFDSDDAKEGARAFVEKRAPVWVGR